MGLCFTGEGVQGSDSLSGNTSAEDVVTVSA